MQKKPIPFALAVSLLAAMAIIIVCVVFLAVYH